jgi:hypothetical protein
MKKLLSGLMALSLVASFAFITTSNAANTPPGQNKLVCFSGADDEYNSNGTCTFQGKGARGPATLNNIDGDDNPYNNYSGVYVESAYLSGTALKDVTKLQFTYTGTATAGSPRFSVLIDEDGDSNTTDDQGYAFIGAYYCNDGAGNVDAINDQTCTIYYGSSSYENWGAFVAAYPDATIAEGEAPVYIVADDAGMWTISGVKLGR